jgi:hypothetical protein
LKVLKCGAEEGWRRSVLKIMWKMGRLTGFVTPFVETAF